MENEIGSGAEQREQIADSELAYWKGEAERWRKEAYTDPLTGVANRRFFDETLEKELGDLNGVGDETPNSLVLLVVDVDNFKQYNDTRGHSAGDDMIKAVAGVLSGSVRKETDWVARTGGDEFTIVLGGVRPEKTEQAVFAINQRIQDNLNAMQPVNLSLSCGSASAVRGEEKSSRQIYDEADKNMYQVKQRKKGE